MRIWTLEMKHLNFSTCKRKGALTWRNPQINKLHGFKLKQKLGLRKNKRKQNQTRAKGKPKVWMKMSYKVEFCCVVIVGMWINFQLCKLTWFQLVFNFNKCNSKFEISWQLITAIVVCYHPLIHNICHIIHLFIHPYYAIHPFSKPSPRQYTRFTNIVGPLLIWTTLPSLTYLTSYPT
jgi:hypothetical protein